MTPPSDVEAYLQGLDDRQRSALERLRATIRAAAPAATETISYQMPAFRDGDRGLVCYAAFRDHYSLFPMSKAVIAEHLDVLGERATGKGTIHFAYDEPLPEGVVATIVEARLEENAARRRR